MHAAAIVSGTSPLHMKEYMFICCGGFAGPALGVEPIPLSVGGQYCGGAVVLAAKTLTGTDCSERVLLKAKHVRHNLSWFAQSYKCAPSLHGRPPCCALNLSHAHCMHRF